MRRFVIAVLVAWFPVQDIVLALAYAATGSPAIGALGHVRDLVVLLGATLAFFTSPLPRSIYLSILSYGLLVLVNIPLGLTNGAQLGLSLASAAVLLLPPMLLLVGYWGCRSAPELDRMLKILIALALASAVFGAWDIFNTAFWTQTASFQKYMVDVKGYVQGFDRTTGLPMNFYHAGERRSAGLLAAPLAQGSFLATMGLLAVARLVRRKASVWGLLILAVCTGGVVESGTRGALVYLVVSLMVFIVSLADTPRKLGISILGMSLLTVSVLAAAWQTILLSLAMADDSSLMHAQALVSNFLNIGSVALIGNGVGLAGARAQLQGFSTEYGGESAIFSIAYQLGVPGAIAFLVFYAAILIGLWRARRLFSGWEGRLSGGLFALGIGATTTFTFSEHILSFSGFAAYWLMAGAMLRVARQASASERLRAYDIAGRRQDLRAAATPFEIKTVQ